MKHFQISKLLKLLLNILGNDKYSTINNITQLNLIAHDDRYHIVFYQQEHKLVVIAFKWNSI